MERAFGSGKDVGRKRVALEGLSVGWSLINRLVLTDLCDDYTAIPRLSSVHNYGLSEYFS